MSSNRNVWYLNLKGTSTSSRSSRITAQGRRSGRNMMDNSDTTMPNPKNAMAEYAIKTRSGRTSCLMNHPPSVNRMQPPNTRRLLKVLGYILTIVLSISAKIRSLSGIPARFDRINRGACAEKSWGLTAVFFAFFREWKENAPLPVLFIRMFFLFLRYVVRLESV